MSLDPSQLTLPQIAVAVAAGELRLADVEAELRRRPPGDTPARRPPPEPRPRPWTPTGEDLLRALARTRRELREATRNLARISERLDALAQVAAAIEPSLPATRNAQRAAKPDERKPRRAA
jgi:hypothetical protein